MTEGRTRVSWLVVLLGALCAGAIVAAVLVVGPASSSQATVRRTATVAHGVVQSTVSGTGNLAPISQLNLGFKTSGTVTHIYVHVGEQVAQGQLLAALDPESAEVTLEQSRADLQSAEAQLAKEEETDGEGTTGASAAASDSGQTQTASAASAGSPSPTPEPSSTTDTTSAQTPTPTPTPGYSKHSSAPAKATTKPTGDASGSSSSAGAASPDSEASTISAATREANLASARAAVRSAHLTVQGDEQAVQDTKLYAPEAGTIVALDGQEGEVVSASGTTKASSSSGSSGSDASGTGASSSTAGSTRAGAASSTGASSAASTGSSSSSFAVLSDLSSMQLVVPLSESEVGEVKVGQIATVTVEALEGRKLAAHVSEVGILSTSNSGVVSYDVTFKLDQLVEGLKPGMGATAEVVVKQAEGLNVPTSAITAGTVTVVRGGKDVRVSVVTGLAGDSSTIVLSGLHAGETVLLPSASTTSTSSTTGRAGRLGLGGAGLGLGGGGGAAFFRGGG